MINGLAKPRLRALITGSNGFIGRALMVKMAGGVEPFDIAHHKRYDVRRPGAIVRASQKCGTIVHLAAIPGVAQCAKDPARANATNATGTFAVVEAARRMRHMRIIFASSVAADRRDSVYGWTKYIGEQWCRMGYEQSDIPVTVLRFANVYGPGSIQKGSVVAKWMRQILYKHANRIAVYGGDQVRDFVFVEDVADVIAWRIRQQEPWDNEPWHYVGSRQLTTLNNLAQMVIQTGRALGIDNVSVLQKDPVDEGRVTAEGQPDVQFQCPTQLEDGLTATWKYFMGMHKRAMAADGKGG